MHAADRYPDLLRVILEIVQNSIDSRALRIDVKINLQKREVAVTDDGSGASSDKLEQGLMQIGQSMKVRDGENYGQFGLGLVAPVGKCDTYTFTSVPKGEEVNGYLQWTFKTDEIRTMSKATVPFVGRDDIVHESVFSPRSRKPGEVEKQPVWWRTRVKMSGVVRDSVVTRITENDLHYEIGLRYGEKIRQRKIKVTIAFTNEEGVSSVERDVVTTEFTGRPLQPFTDLQKESGATVFTLYIARQLRHGRKGEVSFGVAGDPFRIGAKLLVKSAGDFLDEDVCEALTGGIFEGTIVCDKITLNPTRSQFDRNDALVGMCVSIENWYKEVGREQVLSCMQGEKGTRWQALGRRVLTSVRELLKQPAFGDILKRINVGTIGRGHVEVPEGSVLGKEKHSSVTGHGTSNGTPATPRKDTEPKTPKSEQGNHHPVTMGGPKGKLRTEVKDGSFGIRFILAELETVKIPFEFSSSEGTITFNIRHPWFEECESGDTRLMKYYEAVAQIALTLMRYEGSAYGEQFLPIGYDLLEAQVFSILNGDRLTGRRPGRRKLRK